MVAHHKPMPDNTHEWLTRNEVVDLLNTSAQTLKNYERRGILHPVRVPRTDLIGREQVVVVYNPKELAKLPKGLGRPLVSPRAPGETTARACELFREGKSDEAIVIEMRETFERIQELREKWKDAGGADFVVSPHARETLEKMIGPFADVAELIEKVTRAIGAKKLKTA